MSANPPRSVRAATIASALRSHQIEPPRPLHELLQPPPKGGLRELFSRNKSTTAVAVTSGLDKPSPKEITSIPLTGNLDTGIGPPLYQVYSQSVKRINLEAPALSPHSIIRINEQTSTSTGQAGDSNTPAILDARNSAPRKPRRVSAPIAKANWSRKVYVLTTSGHLLQYSGEGTFDRRPEKVLQLGKDSAAFASDAIKGRHYVLHVSQACSADGEPDLDSSKSILSRMRIKTASARRSAKLLLMVFDSPNDLDSWLSAIRTIIGSLGGRPYRPETPEMQPGPQSTRSQRSLVQESAYHLEQPILPMESMGTPPEGRPSTESSTYTVTDLERLRDSRTSDMSHVTGTATSFLDSPPRSPDRRKDALMEVPHLELPDLGPPSLVDFSQRRAQSRLSLMFSNIMRDKSIGLRPPARFSQQTSVQSEPAMTQDQTMPEINRCHTQGHETSHEKMHGQEKELSNDRDAPTNERRLSTIGPLPMAFSSLHPTPEMLTIHRYSRLFPSTPERLGRLPKRYSSLEYSRGRTQVNLPNMASSPPPLAKKDIGRAKSMRLGTEPMSLAQIPLDSSAVSSFSHRCVKSSCGAHEFRSLVPLPNRQSSRKSHLAFGPPAGPPPSCPLPAVPVAAVPFHRQSLTA